MSNSIPTQQINAETQENNIQINKFIELGNHIIKITDYCNNLNE